MAPEFLVSLAVPAVLVFLGILPRPEHPLGQYSRVARPVRAGAWESTSYTSGNARTAHSPYIVRE